MRKRFKIVFFHVIIGFEKSQLKSRLSLENIINYKLNESNIIYGNVVDVLRLNRAINKMGDLDCL